MEDCKEAEGVTKLGIELAAATWYAGDLDVKNSELMVSSKFSARDFAFSKLVAFSLEMYKCSGCCSSSPCSPS